MSVKIRYEHVCDCCKQVMKVETYDINIHMPAQNMQWPTPRHVVGHNIGPHHVCGTCYQPAIEAYVKLHRKLNP